MYVDTTTTQGPNQDNMTAHGSNQAQKPRLRRINNNISFKRCIQILDESLEIADRDSMEEIAEKTMLVKEQVHLLRSYSKAVYAQLRLHCLQTIGHVPMWSQLDRLVKERYVAGMERFAKGAGFDIDKCRDAWMAYALLAGN